MHDVECPTSGNEMTIGELCLLGRSSSIARTLPKSTTSLCALAVVNETIVSISLPSPREISILKYLRRRLAILKSSICSDTSKARHLTNVAIQKQAEDLPPLGISRIC